MSDTERYDRALQFATEKHKGQRRVGGAEYITHPIAVAEMLRAEGKNTDYQITALFHDLLEDTDATEREILLYGSEKILEAVRLLTKQKGYVMAEYVAGIRQNEMAFAVKGADRLHNLRSAFACSEAFKRRYIQETVEWYLDFSHEIPKAVRALAESLETPMPELPFLNEPTQTAPQH